VSLHLFVLLLALELEDENFLATAFADFSLRVFQSLFWHRLHSDDQNESIQQRLVAIDALLVTSPIAHRKSKVRYGDEL
jgi:hypothetical protein